MAPQQTTAPNEQRRLLGRLAIRRARRQIEDGLRDNPEERDAALAHFDTEVGKIDPDNLAAILKFLSELLAVLIPLFVK